MLSFGSMLGWLEGRAKSWIEEEGGAKTLMKCVSGEGSLLGAGWGRIRIFQALSKNWTGNPHPPQKLYPEVIFLALVAGVFWLFWASSVSLILHLESTFFMVFFIQIQSSTLTFFLKIYHFWKREKRESSGYYTPWFLRKTYTNF